MLKALQQRWKLQSNYLFLCFVFYGMGSFAAALVDLEGPGLLICNGVCIFVFVFVTMQDCCCSKNGVSRGLL